MHVYVYTGAGDDAVSAAREAVHAQIVASQKPQTHMQDTSEDELSTLDERELEVDLLGVCIVVQEYERLSNRIIVCD